MRFFDVIRGALTAAPIRLLPVINIPLFAKCQARNASAGVQKKTQAIEWAALSLGITTVPGCSEN